MGGRVEGVDAYREPGIDRFCVHDRSLVVLKLELRIPMAPTLESAQVLALQL